MNEKELRKQIGNINKQIDFPGEKGIGQLLIKRKMLYWMIDLLGSMKIEE